MSTAAGDRLGMGDGPPPHAWSQPPRRDGVADRLRDALAKLLLSARMQRVLTTLPLTRGKARREAAALFDLCAGFIYSQILLACIRLDVFALLAERSRTAAEVAALTGLGQEAVTRLFDAAVALRLLSRRSGGRYGLSLRGAALHAQPGLAAMIEHHGRVYRDFEDPLALLRGAGADSKLAGYWAYASDADPTRLGDDAVAAYTALMAASQPLVSSQVLDVYPVAMHRCLLDVGGGDGSFLTAAAARAPRLQLQLFDLPPVVARARDRLAASGLAHRASVHAGSFFSDALPQGADLVSLVRVLHDHDDAEVMQLLRAVRDCLPADGTLLIAEPLAGVSGSEAVADAYFGFYLMAMGRGRPRTEEQLAAMLRAAGYCQIGRLPTRIPMQTSVLVARPCGQTGGV
ncbi:methyltransferase [Methyloversatilis thermotolerans]|uniref:methyltransferase n=1 Tax=Methyloversatilis thermotolerans TaxID=1346290 RepID=UPI0003798A95|nr:methyltransferase [Methyloversatilis thermotolerans]